jgi:hypothetical protein
VCVPCSTIEPFSITRIVSASRIVERRWAMTNDVRPWASFAIAFWIRTSVRVSTDEVASSSTRITGSDRNARAMVMSCFSPALTPLPSSSMTVS